MAQKSINKDSLDEKSRIMLQVMKILEDQDVDTLNETLQEVKKIESKAKQKNQDDFEADEGAGARDEIEEDNDEHRAESDHKDMARDVLRSKKERSQLKAKQNNFDHSKADTGQGSADGTKNANGEHYDKSHKNGQPGTNDSYVEADTPGVLFKKRKVNQKYSEPFEYDEGSGDDTENEDDEHVPGQHKKQPTGKDFTAAPIQEVTERVSLKRKEPTCTQEPYAKKAKKTKHPKVTERVSLKRKDQTCTQEPDAKKAKKTKHPKEITEAEPVKTYYPCDLCGVLRDRLDKHYKFGHKMSWSAAKSRYRLTKAMVDGGKNVSTCSECGKVVQHLSQHLANMHGIKRSSDRSVQIRQDAKMSLEDQLALVMPKKTETKAKKPVYEGIHIIREFIKWLQTMRGKKTTEKSVKQHGSQATKIWQHLSPNELNEPNNLQFEDITSEGVLEYVEYQRIKMLPGTLRSYLCAFGFFIDFLNSSSCKQSMLDKDTLNTLYKEVQNYSSNLRGDIAQRKAEFALQEHEDLLPASVITHYLESDYLNQIQEKCFKGEVFDSLKEYCAVRDALMAMIVCTNAQRTSAIRDIRPHNVFKAKPEGNMRVFGVASHKTSSSRGVANISLTDMQYLAMKQFALQISQVGAKYQRGDDKHCLLCWKHNDSLQCCQIYSTGSG